MLVFLGVVARREGGRGFPVGFLGGARGGVVEHEALQEELHYLEHMHFGLVPDTLHGHICRLLNKQLHRLASLVDTDLRYHKAYLASPPLPPHHLINNPQIILLIIGLIPLRLVVVHWLHHYFHGLLMG